MPSANERLQDEEIAHALGLQKYSNGVVRRIIALLNRTDADLFAKLTSALDRLPPESFTVTRLEQLLGSVRELNAEAYALVEEALTDELQDFAAYETAFQRSAMTSAMPAAVVAQVDVAKVSGAQAYAAAMARPFQGRTLREWSASIESGRMARIRDAIRIGYTSNETTEQIIRRIRGTRAKGYEDGLIQTDRRWLESVVRTAISHTAAVAREKFIDANQDLIQAVRWEATLDNRTSSECRIRDGKQYTADTHKPIGHKIPWGGGPGQLHWCCRSTSCPVLKSWRDLGIPMDDLDAGERASMDGQVPADTTYSEWLKRQPAARQDEVLGPTRAKEFRAGKPLGSFYNDKGRWLTLDELVANDTARTRAIA